MRKAIPATALLALLFPASVHAAPRAPTGKWVVDFAEHQCVASREYGTADKPLALVFKQPLAGDIMQIGVIYKGRAGKFAEQVDGRLRVDELPAIRSSMIKFGVKERGELVITTNLPLGQFATVRQGQSLNFAAPPSLNETFQLSSVEPLMKVMDSCVADLRRVWNDGSTNPGRLQRGAVGTLQGMFKAEDYPEIAVFQTKGGSVTFVVLVNEQGRVADCTVVQTSGVAALDAQSCAIVVERARFQPATGADGKPAKSIFRQRVTWQITGSRY